VAVARPGQPRSGALSRRRRRRRAGAREVLVRAGRDAATSSTWATASYPPPIRRRSKRSSASCTTRERRRWMRTGVLVMAYAHRRRRTTSRPTTPGFDTAEYPRRAARRSPAPLQRHWRHVAARAAKRRSSDGHRRGARAARARRFDVRFARSTNHHSSRRPPNRFVPKDSTSSWASSSHPTRLQCRRPVHVARQRGAGERVTFIEIGAWWQFPGFLEIIADRVKDALRHDPDSRRETTEVIFSAHSLPEKILATGDTYPNSCAKVPSAPPHWRRRTLGRRVAVGRRTPDRGSVQTSCRSCATNARSA